MVCPDFGEQIQISPIISVESDCDDITKENQKYAVFL